MFGTYIDKGEIILYPFIEYYYDKNAEYKPAEFGYGKEEDYEGFYKATEGLLFVSYGISDWFAFELEAAVIDATLEKAGDDFSGMPTRISESGLGDIEGQLRWRYFKETEKRPELFSYFETVLPLQKDKMLIGTQDWEFKLGTGVTKGYKWGTVTARAAVEYIADEDKFELGEFAVEYLKRVSKSFRFDIVIEGAQDELSAIVDLQFHLKPWMFIRLNSGFALTSKATDITPEAGIVFYLNKK
jgi:hypothetical protein